MLNKIVIKSFLLLFVFLQQFKLLRRYKSQLLLDLKQHQLIRLFMFQLLLHLNILQLLFLLVFNGLPDLLRLHLFLVLLLSHNSPLLHVVAFIYLLLPELCNIGLLIVLSFLQVGRHFIEEESPLAVVSIGHVLLLVRMGKVLELEVGNAGETQSQTRLVALV